MPSLFDMSRRFPSLWGNKKPRYGSGNANGLDYTTQPVKPLGMPGGAPGATGYGTGGGDPYNGQIPSGYSQGYTPNIGGPDPGMAYGQAEIPGMGSYAPGGANYGSAPPPRDGNPPMMPPVNTTGHASPSMTPRPQYVPGSNPATGYQGYTADDFYNGKAGFGAGWGGAEKREWLQNNMTPITGHNYEVDFTEHNANVQNKLAANNAAAMQGWKDNPMYNSLANAVSRPGIDDGGNAPLAGRMSDAVKAQAANWQNPDWVMQQVLAGKAAPQTWQQQQAMLDQLQANDPEKYAEYLAKMQAMGVNPRQAPKVGTSGNPFGN